MATGTQTAVATIVTVMLLMAVSTGTTYFIFRSACAPTAPVPIGPGSIALPAETQPVLENSGDVFDQTP